MNLNSDSPATTTLVAATGGDAVADALVAEGIDTVFGLPGIQLDPLLDAFVRRRHLLRFIHTRNEQATTHMADGFARASGRVGCSVVVPGPGLLNAMTGLATAYGASSPVLCITGQIASKDIDRALGHLHEIPRQLEMIRSVSKWSGRAMAPSAIPALMNSAFQLLRSGRPRPVVVEVPPDVLAGDLDDSGDADPAEAAEAEASLQVPVEAAVRLLRSARKPLIAAGGGVLQGNAWVEVCALARLLEAPVLMTPQAKGTISARDPLAFEWVAAPDLIPEADVVVAVGTRYANPDASRRRLFPGQRMIRVDVDASEIARVPSDVSMQGDAAQILRALLSALNARGRDQRSAWDSGELASLKSSIRRRLDDVHPQAEFGAVLRQELPDDAIVIHGMTQMGYWARLGFEVYEPRTFIGPGYMGALGFELATGLGAQAAAPEQKVVILAGDGGFMFGIQELATAAQHGLNAICIVFNDGAFGNVRRIQQEHYGGRFIASDLRNPDFVRLAEAFSVEGLRAHDADGLRTVLRRALTADRPVLIEVPVGEMAALRRLSAMTKVR
jgi:acetolactate synthase-1/2/3 large subunit